MPPPSRESAVADPTSRGIRYLSCASSTCSLPSRVLARRAKMSRISCVRSTTLRSSACSRLRSCAGRELVVENDEVDRRFVACRGEHRDLAAAEKRRRIRFGALLQHAQTDIGAGGGGQPGQLVERMFGIELSRGVLEEADERRPFPRHSRDLITRSHGSRPARISLSAPARAVDDRRRRTAPRRPAVDHRVHVRQRRRARRGRRRCRRPPDRFALVAVTQKPVVRQRAAQSRDPVRGRRPCRRRRAPQRAIDCGLAGTTIVSGPGHQRAASRSVRSSNVRALRPAPGRRRSASAPTPPRGPSARTAAGPRPRCADRPPGRRACRSDTRRRARRAAVAPLHQNGRSGRRASGSTTIDSGHRAGLVVVTASRTRRGSLRPACRPTGSRVGSGS